MQVSNSAFSFMCVGVGCGVYNIELEMFSSKTRCDCVIFWFWLNQKVNQATAVFALNTIVIAIICMMDAYFGGYLARLLIIT